MEREKCHHSVWIRRFKHGDLISSNIIRQLDKEHEAMHDLADEILQLHQQNQVEKLSALLLEMDEINHRLITLIDEVVA